MPAIPEIKKALESKELGLPFGLEVGGCLGGWMRQRERPAPCGPALIERGRQNKCYSRDFRERGRFRIQLNKADGSPLNPAFPSRQSILLFVANAISKLPARPHLAAAAAAAAAEAGESEGAAAAATVRHHSNKKNRSSKKKEGALLL